MEVACEPCDGGNDAAGGDRNFPLGDGEPRFHVDDPDGFHDGVVIIEGLAHAHEYDIGDIRAVPPEVAPRGDELVENFAGGQVADEAHRPRTAE